MQTIGDHVLTKVLNGQKLAILLIILQRLLTLFPSSLRICVFILLAGENEAFPRVYISVPVPQLPPRLAVT